MDREGRRHWQTWRMDCKLTAHAKHVRFSPTIMKTLILLGIAAAGAFWLRSENTKAEAKARVHQQAFLTEMRAPKAPGEETPHSGNFVVVKTGEGTYRARELQPGVSQMQGVGGGSYGAAATPVPTTAETVRRDMGLKGTSLDAGASGARRGR